MSFSRTCLHAFVFFVVLLGVTFAQTSETTQRAVSVGEKWLTFLDEGNAGEAWDAASDLLKSSVSRVKWADVVKQTRSPLGSVTTRVLGQVQQTTELPGAPNGNYIVAQFETSLTTGRYIETLILAFELDEWKPAGYFIKPSGN